MSGEDNILFGNLPAPAPDDDFPIGRASYGGLNAAFLNVPQASPPAILMHVTDPNQTNVRGFPATVAHITGQLLDDNKTFRIDNILGGETLSTDKPTEGVGTVGSGNLLKIWQMLKAYYPAVENIQGERVSGVRTGRPAEMSVTPTARPLWGPPVVTRPWAGPLVNTEEYLQRQREGLEPAND